MKLNIFFKLSLFCVFVSLCRSESTGFSSKELRDVIDICCKRGESYGLMSSKPENCNIFNTEDPPAAVPYERRRLCMVHSERCCRTVVQKKNECNVGISYTITSVDSCNQLNDMAKFCCNECRSGRKQSKTPEGCASHLAIGRNSAEQLLAANAFTTCRSAQILMDRCKYADPKPCEHYCEDEGGIDVSCKCMRGYQLGADRKSCDDIDECTNGTANCGVNADCTNVKGSYECTCHPNYLFEYTPEGFRCVVDNRKTEPVVPSTTSVNVSGNNI